MPRCSDAPTAAPRRPRSPSPRYRYVRCRWTILFFALDAIGSWLMKVAGCMARLRGPRPIHDGSIKKILVVQLDHLGDAILSTGMLGELARRYPQARIEVLAAPWNAEVFAALPSVSRVYVCRSNRFARGGSLGWPLAIAYWGWQLRRQRFDLGIDIRGEFPLALLLWLAGIGRRVGWSAGGGGFLLTDSAEYQPTDSQTAARARLLDAIDRLPGGTNPAPRPGFEPGVPSRARMELKLRTLAPGPLVVAHLAAGTQAKRWPAIHWQELFGRLILRFEHLQIVLVGSADEQSRANEVLGGRAWPRVADWTGELGVCDLAALIARASCFVGADSGPAHLAAAVGTPAVVLFSGTNDPRVWRPSGDVVVLRHAVECSPCHRTRCPLADHPCMRGIQPRQVAAAIADRLASSRSRLEMNVEAVA